MNNGIDVVGIGNAIVDVLANTDDAFLERYGLVKGAMTLVAADRAADLYREMPPGIECSGGSAANTMVGLASLGGKSAYVGKVRDDELGRVFTHDIRAAGVAFDVPAAGTGPGTGRCLVLVTPDAQRTMQTFLGSSACLGPADLPEAVIQAARITYLEGYLWDPPPAKQAFRAAARIAHAAGREVALTLSDAFCVERHREEFRELVAAEVDILFANEVEILSLYETDRFDRAVADLRGSCRIAALTRGERGSVVVTAEQVVEVPAAPVERVVDTTGAGDLYAAGFLRGLTTGRDAEACARLGGIAAAEIISHFGARPATSLADLVRVQPGRTPAEGE